MAVFTVMNTFFVDTQEMVYTSYWIPLRSQFMTLSVSRHSPESVGTEYATVVLCVSVAQQYLYVEGQINFHEKFQRHEVRPATVHLLSIQNLASIVNNNDYCCTNYFGGQVVKYQIWHRSSGQGSFWAVKNFDRSHSCKYRTYWGDHPCSSLPAIQPVVTQLVLHIPYFLEYYPHVE